MSKRFRWIPLFAFCLLAVSAAGVWAHEAEVVESSPRNGEILATAPAEVWARFAEELVSDESSIRVLDAAGNQVDNGDGGLDLFDAEHETLKVTLPALEDGVYTVEYQVMLLDGDVTEGAFAFTVGDGAGGAAAVTPAASSAESTLPLPVWLVAILAGLIIVIGLGLAWLRTRPRQP